MPRTLEKYLEVGFPSTLFICSDDLHSMHFVLSLKHMPHTNQEELVELLNHCGAELSFDAEHATDYSAVIVDHDDVVGVRAPAFTLNYLEECLDSRKVQNISNYRQDTTKHIAKNIECMDIIYFRKMSWDSALTEAEKQWFADKVNSSKSAQCSEFPVADINGDTRSVNKRPEGCEQEDISQSKGQNSKTTYGSRLSSDEDSDLEVVDNRVIEDRTCENANQTKSTKSNLNTKNKKSGNPETKENNSDLSKCLSNAVTVPSTSSKWSFLNDFQSESSDEEPQPKEVKNKKEKKFFDFKAGEENLFEVKDKKHSRLPYSYEEQSKILKYIIDRCQSSRLKGRDFWIVMERRKICPNRTWQSMKEHFMKKIIMNLEAFDFLTESDKMKIKQALTI